MLRNVALRMEQHLLLACHICVESISFCGKLYFVYLAKSHLIFSQRLCLVVKTDGSHSLEENMRQTLLACYREFGDILQQMAITHVHKWFTYKQTNTDY